MQTRAPVAEEALVVSEVFPPSIGGSGELLSNVYRRLSAVRVTVLTDEVPGAPTRSSENGLTVIRQPMRAPSWGLLRPAGLRFHLRQAGVLRRLSANTPAIIHCARALPEGVGAWLATRTTRGPYLCWAHGEEVAFARGSRELSFLMRRVHKHAAALIANSRNTAAMLTSAGARPDSIEVVYPGVDARRFRPGLHGAADLRARLLAGADILALTVGRLQRRKGHDLVLEALAGIDRRELSIRYVIVGDGEERERLEAMVERLQIPGSVRFAGAVPVDELPMYYAAADIFVHPNRVEGADVEGFGIVFLEAGAAGLPVIAGDSGGVPEAVADGETGLLVSGTSVDQLRDTLTRLARSPDLRRTLGAAGRARAERQFSWEQAASRVTAIHHAIADRLAGRQGIS
jgi:phosphatidylinositol alpha-1,6-mannosyltransferase